MKITIKQCGHKKVELKNDVLYLDDNAYKSGDIIIGFINKESVEGRLYIFENNLYFLQNLKNGASPPLGNKLNFKYSWSFSKIDKSFSEDVKLFNYKKEKDFNIEKLELKYPKPTFMMDSYSVLRKTSTNRDVFKISPIPDCCGATLLSQFRRDSLKSSPEYVYSDLETNEIDQFLKNNITSNKIAYLLKNEESQAIEFLINKLNFKIVDEFKNSNTQNIIQLLSRNDT